MEKKKLKLSISGSRNKTINSIEQARNQSKNTVVIEKKPKRFLGKSTSSRPFVNNDKFKNKSSLPEKTPNFSRPPQHISSDFEKRKLAEQRATKRIKGETSLKENKANKIGGKRRELKLTISRALSDDEMGTRSRSLASLKRAKQKENRILNKNETKESLKPIKRNINIPELITIRELANRMAEQSSNIIKHLLGMGVTVTINHTIDSDTAEYLVKEFGHNPIKDEKAEEIIEKIKEVKTENLKSRAPIVTVMGHVDHGKTSVLDVLRKANVVSGEFGGITQHIGAYQINHNNNKITFIDTPGHAAFTEMRARGSKLTDIVILVVAADDGVKPQTVESIKHAKAAGVPIVVAINKCDLPDADPQKIKNQLLEYELIAEDLSGDTLMVEISTKTKQNLDKLVESIVLQAELLDLKTDFDNESATLGVCVLSPEWLAEQAAETPPESEESFKTCVEDTLKNYGKLNPKWSERNFMYRGKKKIPVQGGPDVLRAIYGLEQEDKDLKAVGGDGLYIHVSWDKDGNQESKSIHQYGSATQDESSSHFSDQLELYIDEKYKPTFYEDAVLKRNVIKEYTVPFKSSL